MTDNILNHVTRYRVIGAAVIVVLWRAAALRWPSSLTAAPDGLQVPFALLGVAFLLCGVLAWWLRPGRFTAVFLLYGLCGGIHWGGAIGAPEPLAFSLFFVYLSATALGDAALLHLAYAYPHGASPQSGWLTALYLPAGASLLFAFAAPLAPQGAMEAAAGAVLLLANLFSLAAGCVFIARLIAADREQRRRALLPLIVIAMVSAALLALLGAGGVLPGEPEAWNLALVAVPVALTVALLRRTVERAG